MSDFHSSCHAAWCAASSLSNPVARACFASSSVAFASPPQPWRDIATNLENVYVLPFSTFAVRFSDSLYGPFSSFIASTRSPFGKEIAAASAIDGPCSARPSSHSVISFASPSSARTRVTP